MQKVLSYTFHQESLELYLELFGKATIAYFDLKNTEINPYSFHKVSLKLYLELIVYQYMLVISFTKKRFTLFLLK